jgi:hypothetical protein
MRVLSPVAETELKMQWSGYVSRPSKLQNKPSVLRIPILTVEMAKKGNIQGIKQCINVNEYGRKHNS